MKQVFTRWPGDSTAPSAEAGASPSWLRDGVESGATLLPRPRWLLAPAVGVPLLSVPLLPVALGGATLIAAALLIIAAATASAWAILQYDRKLAAAHARLAASERWSRILFERAGLSLWHEDWSAARDAVADLLARGIYDVQAYYTERPQELRDLRRRVTIKDVNIFAVEMMGAGDKAALIGPLDNILPDTDHTFMQWLVAFARGDRYYRSETHILAPDGTAVDTLFTAEIPTDPAGFEDIVVSALDITGYRASQERLLTLERDMLRASRITTMGALTASIAHEVNSPLSAIVSYAEASLRWLGRTPPDLSEARTAIREVIADATRARDVVRRTRTFLAHAPERAEPVSLAQAARTAVLLIERELRDSEISVHFDADEDLPHVLADPVQIQQVLVNLMLNGAQAMAHGPVPRDLTITIRRSGAEVLASVRDNGIGIEPEQADRIFEPFYTSRDGGMGMGLAICRSVVEGCAGRMWMTSSPGEGSDFRFSLPTAADDAVATARSTAAAPNPG